MTSFGMIGQRIGNHRLIRLLGEGGMGMVFEAVHEVAGGHAAVKILRAEVAQRADIAARFFNEARAANSIAHPSIVRIFDCGYSPEGYAFLTMEFLEGESLRSRLDKSGSTTPADTMRIARQIASALHAAHQKNIVHRDLKPDNIMLVPDSELAGGERIKILDFGIAKISEGMVGNAMKTRSDMMMGTPTYMAPEQCRAAKLVTDRSDVYSLGVILYQMLSGNPPFIAESLGELIAMHLADTPVPMQQAAPKVTPALARLVDSMLDKQPTARPSMESVARELSSLGAARVSEPLQPLNTNDRPTEPLAALKSTSVAFRTLTGASSEKRPKPRRMWAALGLLGACLPVLAVSLLPGARTKPAPAPALLTPLLASESRGDSILSAGAGVPPTSATGNAEAMLGGTREELERMSALEADPTAVDAKQPMKKLNNNLFRATQAYRQMNYPEVLRLAHVTAEEYPVESSWLIGMTACKQKQADAAIRAINFLRALKQSDPKVKPTAIDANIDQIRKECQLAGLIKGTDGSFHIPDARQLKDSAERLKIATNLYSVGQYQKAQEIAQQQLGYRPVEAWEVIGLCACGQDDVKMANHAYAELSIDKSRQTHLLEECNNVHDVKFKHGVFSVK